MPRHPSTLTTYDLLHTPGLYAGLYRDHDGNIVFVPLVLTAISTHKDGTTTPVLRFASGADLVMATAWDDRDGYLFEPYELPQGLRDLLWPREAAPVAPLEPVPTGSSDYDEPAS